MAGRWQSSVDYNANGNRAPININNSSKFADSDMTSRANQMSAMIHDPIDRPRDIVKNQSSSSASNINNNNYNRPVLI